MTGAMGDGGIRDEDTYDGPSPPPMITDPDRWQAVRALLSEARRLPAPDRAAWLDEAVADPDLRAEAARLLAADDATDGFLATPAADRAPALFDDADDAYLGRRVGPWRLAEKIGEGGMGVVFRAERADADFEQEAALKLVGRGLAPTAVVERFRQERRILARLDHPAIARLLDGGLSDDGQPYFAMELVRGVPLTAYADDRGLGVPDRLRLARAVCEAVAYAHQNLVVHRDLKPSNVLVVEDGHGRPHVKLLDFGISKLLDDDASGAPTRTTALMTPAYAAPEQVRGGAITTATDVYALGVLLYEMLAGQRPYQIEAGSAPTTVERVVCETDPPPPSTVAPSDRARRIRGDLDTVVLKALAKDPAHRYVSASALADDLSRVLDGFPVVARRPTLGHRVGSFVRRHPVGVGLSSVAVLALLLGLAGTTWQARVAARERDRAQVEAAKAGEIRDYVLGLFAVANPDSARGRTVTARELLDIGAERVAAELADQPLVRAEMELTIALLYRRIGLFDEARPHLDAAVALREDHLGPGHPETAMAYRERALFLTDTGQYEASHEAAQRAYEVHQAALGPDDPETLLSLSTLATTLVEVGEMARADSTMTVLVARYRSASDSAALGEALYNLGSLRHRQHRFAEAEAPLRESVAIRRGLHGAVHSQTANSVNSLGLVIARGGGDLNEAEALLLEALDTRRQLYGPRHPEVAQMLNNLARLYEEKGDLDEAEATYEALVPLAKDVLGADHPNTGIVLVNYGSLLREQGRPAEAEQHVREGLAVALAAHGRDHPNTALSEVHLAQVLVALGRRGPARPLIEHALPILQGAFGPDAPPVRRAIDVQSSLG